MDFIHPQKNIRNVNESMNIKIYALQPGKGGDVYDISWFKSFGHLMDIYTANPLWA